MTTEVKKQKLQEYLNNALPEEIDVLYDNFLDETGPTEWSGEFAAEMEERVREIENGEVQTIPMVEVFADIRKTNPRVREHDTVSR